MLGLATIANRFGHIGRLFIWALISCQSARQNHRNALHLAHTEWTYPLDQRHEYYVNCTERTYSPSTSFHHPNVEVTN